VPCDPLSRPAKGAPVADVKARLQAAPVWLLSRLEPATGCARVQ
jgi:hypothetical protein